MYNFNIAFRSGGAWERGYACSILQAIKTGAGNGLGTRLLATLVPKPGNEICLPQTVAEDLKGRRNVHPLHELAGCHTHGMGVLGCFNYV